MTDVFAISELSMLNDMRRLDIISHNLANATTGAYKRDIPILRSFDDQFETDLTRLDFTPASTENTVPAMDTFTDYSQGAFSRTNNALDVAIEGAGFFELLDGQNRVYTRQGSFQLDASGRLVSSGGLPVSGLSGDIRLTGDNPRIDSEGTIWEGEDAVAQLKLVSLLDPSALVKTGNGAFMAEGELRTQTLTSPSLRQGFIETSNVEVADEMVKMMTTVRHFEATQQVIRGYDEILGTAIETIAEF